MNTTGHYQKLRDAGLIPPEYVGKTWEQRSPQDESGKVQSPFPPATIGNPAEDVEAHADFRRHFCASNRGRHAEMFCERCRGGLEYPTIESGGRVCKRCIARADAADQRALRRSA